MDNPLNIKAGEEDKAMVDKEATILSYTEMVEEETQDLDLEQE
jgi:hypothetical protein